MTFTLIFLVHFVNNAYAFYLFYFLSEYELLKRLRQMSTISINYVTLQLAAL